ncbi:hypothetical protein [Desulfuribacillus stibiiarsenatis]|nr:hypothetical protein [Desulfuribacillus stibiiarsenatis]
MEERTILVILGIIAAILTIIEKILNILEKTKAHHRNTPTKRKKRR